jgi:hypothetical protein
MEGCSMEIFPCLSSRGFRFLEYSSRRKSTLECRHRPHFHETPDVHFGIFGVSGDSHEGWNLRKKARSCKMTSENQDNYLSSSLASQLLAIWCFHHLMSNKQHANFQILSWMYSQLIPNVYPQVSRHDQVSELEQWDFHLHLQSKPSEVRPSPHWNGKRILVLCHICNPQTIAISTSIPQSTFQRKIQGHHGFHQKACNQVNL